MSPFVYGCAAALLSTCSPLSVRCMCRRCGLQGSRASPRGHPSFQGELDVSRWFVLSCLALSCLVFQEMLCSLVSCSVCHGPHEVRARQSRRPGLLSIQGKIKYIPSISFRRSRPTFSRCTAHQRARELRRHPHHRDNLMSGVPFGTHRRRTPVAIQRQCTHA